MKHILISGYYGFNNNGDEAILEQMLDNLRSRLENVSITVFSHNPEDTEKRYGVRAVNRMSPSAVLREIRDCDLLISGGGSLLQDATSKRSLLYYLAIIRMAKFFHKKVFIYSQGIGPISTRRNRRLTASCLKKTDGIVVRDLQSRDLLKKIGVDNPEIHVSADPVVRSRCPSLDIGEALLKREGWQRQDDRLLVGWAMKEMPGEEEYTERQMDAIRNLVLHSPCDVLLIPFHSSQDPAVARKMYQQLDSEPAIKGKVWLLRGHHTAEEILSVVGNLQILVGVRLHSLIYAAVMGVPMLGISYDPKIDSFLNSLGVEPVSSLSDFTVDRFEDCFMNTVKNYSAIIETIEANIQVMKESLSLNEDMVAELLQQIPDRDLVRVSEELAANGKPKVVETASGMVVIRDDLDDEPELSDEVGDDASDDASAGERLPEGALPAEVPLPEEEVPADPAAPDTAFLEEIYGSAPAEENGEEDGEEVLSAAAAD